VKLTSITIDNLFSYHGINKINFDAITCIIGSNGFGKTSILNSIKLCLGQSNIDINSICNNSAKERQCSVDLDFHIFSIRRAWNFEPKFEESLKIIFEDGSQLEDTEAEHFIQNKIPDFLIDFLFYDGEINNNLLLLSNTKLKSIFDFIFDLDLLVNTQKDAQEVSKRLLEKNKDNTTIELIELENKRIQISDIISKQKEELLENKKELKKFKNTLQKLNTQIKNRSKKTQEFHKELEQIQEKLNIKAILFKEIILWQMPLLLNNNLLTKMQTHTSSALKIENESLFINRFEKFAQKINSSMSYDSLLETFRALMLNASSKVNLSMNKKEFFSLLDEMKNLKQEIKQLEEKIKFIQDSAMEQEIMRSLIESRDEQLSNINTLEQALHELEDNIEQNILISKEINKTLTQSFKANQDKYAFIRGYEELQSIARVSAKVYKNKLEDKLSIFNEKLKENTTNFLKQYEHIQDIYIDTSHKIVISDGKKLLNTELLSAGQKQVLNFLIVKTILDFKEFASFVMVDTPFGRLSNKNKELLLNTCYLSFENLILLLTDSEFEFIKTQNLRYKHYQIQRDSLGSIIEEIA
jgi:DNA sulfur modification protein DndD